MKDTPMIGVLSQPLSSSLEKDPRMAGYTSYIMDSYIKYIEASGGRAVPLLYKGNTEEILKKLDHLNGVFYCGGAADDDDYFNLGKAIYEKVKKFNDQGVHYPIWGTCLGF